MEKDKEIEKLKENIYQVQQQFQITESEQKNNIRETFGTSKEFSYDNKFYILNNMHTTENLNKLDYNF